MIDVILDLVKVKGAQSSEKLKTQIKKKAAVDWTTYGAT